MGFEIDQLQREESYRNRLSRTLVLISITVGVGLMLGFFLLGRQQKVLEEAQANEAEQALLAAAAVANGIYAADSLHAFTRMVDFSDKYKTEKIEGANLMMAPVPEDQDIQVFINECWNDFILMYQPEATQKEQESLFRTQIIDVMNRAWYNRDGRIEWQGEEPPKAVLLPGIKFQGKNVRLLKASFPQIVRGQEAAGIRLIEQSVAEDSSLAQIEMPTDSTLAP